MKFGDYDTGTDWGLFCSGIEITGPEVQRYQVEVPGRHGKLDLTNTLFDEPKFYNRTGTFTFDAPAHAPQEWHDLMSDIRGKLHGQTVQIILDEDSDWYYTGLLEVSADEDAGEITITADMEPFKQAVEETVVTVSSSGAISLANDRMTVIPTVVTTGETMIVIGTSSLSMSAGTYYLSNYPLYEGTTTWTITTSSAVTITYRQGRL